MKRLLYTLISIILVCGMGHSAIAKRYDATLTFISNNMEKNDIDNIISQFSKNFTEVQTFDLTRNTNFYLHYYLTDENYLQFEIARADGNSYVAENSASPMGDGQVGSQRYEEYKKESKLNLQFSSGRRDNETTVIIKPFKGRMVLYNSYGTELFSVESRDHYKTESGALKNTISQMRRELDRQKDKMAIRQKPRCLFCDYGDLKDRQKQKVGKLAYIIHREQLNQLYGEVREIELPLGMAPYANIYASQKDYDALDHLVSTGSLSFTNQPEAKRLPGHLLSIIINDNAPDEIIQKIAGAYKKDNFQELDINNLTAFWAAISQQDLALMDKLIDLGVDVNQITNVSGAYLTPLIVSAQYGSGETTEVLLNNGARKELVTPSGITAWSSAMWLAKYDHAERLWPNDLFDTSSLEAQNFMIQAAYYGRLERVKELHELGVPISARGLGGDNIPIAAIKGIKTFSIEPDFKLPGAALHKTGSQVYWDIIEMAENAGLSNSVTTAMDTKKQTVLFHAYPEGSDTVKDQHLDLIAQLIQKGVGPNISNIDGQNADQAYLNSRMAYLDSLYESQQREINAERKAAATRAQEKQDQTKEAASELIAAQDTRRSNSRASVQSRRREALRKVDARTRAQGGTLTTSEFVKDTSDVDQTRETQTALEGLDEKIRETYANEVRIANEVAKQKIDELEEMIEGLKLDEEENALSRRQKIEQVLNDISP